MICFLSSKDLSYIDFLLADFCRYVMHMQNLKSGHLRPEFTLMDQIVN